MNNNLILNELKKEGITYFIYSINNVLISLNIIFDNKVRKTKLDHICRSFHSEFLYRILDDSRNYTLDETKDLITKFIENYNENTNCKIIPYQVDDFYAFEVARTQINDNEYPLIKFYLYQFYPYNSNKDILYYVKKKNKQDEDIMQVSDQYYLKAIKKPKIANRNLYYLSQRWEFGLNNFITDFGRIGKTNNSLLFDVYKLHLRNEVDTIYINSIKCPYIKNRNNQLNIYSVFIDNSLKLIHDSICSINNDIVLRIEKIK